MATPSSPVTADLSDLPPDLLHHISKKLPSLLDFIRFRAVCTKFRSSTSLSDPPPQLPWLLENLDPFTNNDSTSLRFYSLSSGAVHTITCPKSDGKWIKGPSHHYLLTCHCTTDEMSLLNPLTDHEISLPFLDVTAAWPDWIGPDIVVISGDSLVMSGDSFYSNTDKLTLAYSRPGDNKWVTMEIDMYDSGRNMYFNGMYFTFDKTTRVTKIIDLASKTVLLVISPAEAEIKTEAGSMISSYLVESAGDILRVVQSLSLDLLTGKNEKWCFDIYRLEFGDLKVDPYWVKINGIGVQMLFLDLFHGFRGLSLSASNFDGFRGNCIYFFDCNYFYKDNALCRYDIENDMVEELSCFFKNGGTWIVPSLC